jgi:hypothetical protein
LSLFLNISAIETKAKILLEASYQDFRLFNLHITAVKYSFQLVHGAKIKIILRTTKEKGKIVGKLIFFVSHQ